MSPKTRKRRRAEKLERTRAALPFRRYYRAWRRETLRANGLGPDCPLWLIGMRYHHNPNAKGMWNGLGHERKF